MGRCKLLHAFQLFDTALRLASLSCLGFKAVNIFLNMCACFLLFLKSLLLLCQAFATCRFKGGVVACI